MKKSIFMILMSCVACVCIFTTGCDEENGKELRSNETEKQVEKELQNKISSLQNKISSLELEKKNLLQKLEKAKVAQQEAEKKARSQYIVLNVIAYIALGIGASLILAFVFLVMKSSKKTAKSAIRDMHCPRCDWEYSLGDTICKNCGTKF